MTDLSCVKTNAVCVVVLALIALSECSCVAQSVTLSAAADTYLREAYPNTNYGDEIDLELRNDLDASSDRTVLIGFDVSSIPASACITHATLRLYQYDSQYMNESDWLKVGAYRLLKHADEGTGGYKNGASWYYRHNGGLDYWSQYGARGRSTDPDRHSAANVGVADSVATVTYVPTGGPGRWVEWDVTPSAQYWHRNPARNFGLVLDKWLEGSYCYDDDEFVRFWSRHYGDPNYRPQLVVSYMIPSAQTPVTLAFGQLSLNYFNGDPGITLTQDSGQLRCGGATTNTNWADDGAATTYTLNTSFECEVKVKLQQGIVGVDRGQFALSMWQDAAHYIRLMSVGHGNQYYEVSGQCAAVGNGERHDGSAYWASYWDDGYPSAPPSSAVLFFSETPSAEQNAYQTWKIRYDKANQVFCVYVTDGAFSRLVTYYTGVNLSNYRIAIVHNNDVSGVPTDVWTIFPDNLPPSPDPMTWLNAPHAAGTSQIDMTAATATDDTPPIIYQFEETTGNPGGTSSGWQSSTAYSDGGLSANTRYGYRVRAQDSAVPANTTAYSVTGYCYTLIPTPTGCKASSPTATTVSLAAAGSFPNLDQGETGVRFQDVGGLWAGQWRLHQTTDTATGLTPNTVYTFKARAQNGDAVPTDLSPVAATVRTLAARPLAAGYGPVTTQSIQANWHANGNPEGTQYFCWEDTTGRKSGWITDTYWRLTHLEPTTPYHFHVKARNADGVETHETDLGSVTTTESIAMIKRLPPGSSLRMASKIVSAVFDSERICFVQDWPDMDRPWGGAGICVRFPDTIIVPLREGQLVDIAGALHYNDPPYSEELVVRAEEIRVVGQAPPIVAFGSAGRGTGGGVFGQQPGVYDDIVARPPTASYGLNDVGMLVKTWGRAFAETAVSGYAWLQDGSALHDGHVPGVRVDLRPIGSIWPFPAKSYCSVTGVMRCFVVEPGGYNVRVIWPRRISDLARYPEGITPD